MKPTKQTEAAILEAYHIFWEANLSADMETFGSYLVDDFSIFGSANGEEFFSKQEAVAFYTATADQMRGKAQLRNRNISIQCLSDDSVVVMEQSHLFVLIENNWTFYGYARISCILKYNGNTWMAVHQHASFPDHRTESGQQLAAKKIQKENLELREAVQRRTVELQQKNRELEIEAAVERVRAQSMAMQQTSDIAQVNEVLFQQLTKLKIENFTGVAIYLVDDEEMVTVWDLSSPGSMNDEKSYAFKYDPKVTPTLSEFIPIWRAGKEDYFIMDYPKERLMIAAEELEPFYPDMTQSSREAIAGGALEHQWNATARIDSGVLSLDLMTPPTEEVKSITLKMAAAFNLAYQRFHDLQNSEKQTKEAQIELSLERVRARSLAMHNTNELQEMIQVVHQELLNLNIAIAGGSFIAINSDIRNELRCWGSDGTADTSAEVCIPLYEKPFCTTLINSIKKGPGFFTEEYSQEEKKEFFTFLFKHEPWSKLDAEHQLETLSSPGGYTRSCSVSKHTSIFIINHFGERFSAADNETLQRFGKVFEQAYTRFLDLRKAEAQAREAQIEAALEKVRSRSLAMHRSDELKEVMTVMFEKMTELDVLMGSIAIQVFDERTKDCDFWVGNDLQQPALVKLPYNEKLMNKDTYLKQCWEAKYSGEHIINKVDTPEQVSVYFEYVFSNNDEVVIPLPVREFIRQATQHSYCLFIEKNSSLFVDCWSGKLYGDEQIIVLKRVAKVFEQAYVRFLDLKKAEAQAKEAQIEAALERVRSRSMAMLRSEELAELSLELVKQVQALGVATWFCAFNIYDDDPQGSMEWGSNGQGTFPKYRTPKEGIFLRYFEAGQSGETLVVNEIGENECGPHYEYLCTLPGVGDELLKMKEAGIPFPVSQIDHVAFFKYGYVLFITYEPISESHDIFKRFAKVFEQTYTRFLDLQKAEAQAEIARLNLIQIQQEKQRAEDALTELQLTQKQLIQSEKMASLGELTAGIAHEIQNPLNFVNNFSEVSKELLDEMKEAIEKGDKEEAKEIMIDVIQNLEKINHHGRRADSIVKGMLQHSRSSSNQKEPININVLADEYLRLAYHGLRAKDKSFNAILKTDYDETIGNINIIPQDIGRVVLNLITNAFYAVDEKKKSGIKGYEPTVSVSTKKINDKVEIKVADNGNGIPQNIIDKIFQPFFTTKPTGQGTGLGLSLAYDIVKAHGGELKVDSKQEEGSCFIIKLQS